MNALIKKTKVRAPSFSCRPLRLLDLDFFSDPDDPHLQRQEYAEDEAVPEHLRHARFSKVSLRNLLPLGSASLTPPSLRHQAYSPGHPISNHVHRLQVRSSQLVGSCVLD